VLSSDFKDLAAASGAELASVEFDIHHGETLTLLNSTKMKKSRDPLSVKQIPLGRSPDDPRPFRTRSWFVLPTSRLPAAGGLISFSAWIH
jgi:hypothetical protein